MNQVHQAARSWVEQGFAVIPIIRGAKTPDNRALRAVGSVGADGKAAWGAYQKRLPTPRELSVWFDNGQSNLAVVTGWRGLTVLDFDTQEAYSNWLQAAGDVGGVAWQVATESYQVITARGRHLYVMVDAPVHATHGPGWDVKAAGGYVLVPPSLHPSGHVYRAMDPTASIIRLDTLDALLTTHTEHERVTPARAVAVPKVVAQYGAGEVCDPWQAASQPATSEQSLIAQIKRAFRIVDFIPDAIPTGNDWLMAKCPLHDDNHASLWIDGKRQLCGCFAGCHDHKPMDVINLVAELWGTSNHDAILFLAKVVRSSAR